MYKKHAVFTYVSHAYNKKKWSYSLQTGKSTSQIQFKYSKEYIVMGFYLRLPRKTQSCVFLTWCFSDNVRVTQQSYQLGLFGGDDRPSASTSSRPHASTVSFASHLPPDPIPPFPSLVILFFCSQLGKCNKFVHFFVDNVMWDTGIGLVDMWDKLSLQ